MNQPIQIQRKAIEHDLQLLRARVQLQKARIDAFTQRGHTERRLVCEIYDQLHPESRSRTLIEWLSAHVGDSKAQEDMLRFELAQLESQVAILEAMLREGERNVVVPGAFRQ